VTLDQLLVLSKIAETGSFRAAAGALHRAQSAVSYAIKNLEDELGVELLCRDQYRPTLTPAGEAVLLRAQRVLAGADEILELARQLKQGDEPFVNLAISAIVPMGPVIPALKDVGLQKPHLILNLRVEVLAAQVKVQEDQADLAISELLQNKPGTEGLEKALLGNVRLLPVCAPGHPLAALKILLKETDLRSHTQIILPSSDAATKDVRAGVMEGAGTWSVSDFASKRHLLLGGLGWGLMPLSLVDEDLQTGRLTALHVEPYTDFSIPIYLMRKRKKFQGPCSELMWSILSAVDLNSRSWIGDREAPH
jgi:DNA-binding transcriptional LysR family regulator